jgi:dolichyl-phosphate-mannose-protein mannosyltransferase
LSSHAGEWDDWLYVFKLALGGWLTHFGKPTRFAGAALISAAKSRADTVPFLIMGRVTYLHHYVRIASGPDKGIVAHHVASQLPTLWFAVLMIGHMLDTFVFQSSKRSNRAKWIWFGVLAGSIFLCFMWFRAMAFGITGPIKDHRGLRWRKVSDGYTFRPTKHS